MNVLNRAVRVLVAGVLIAGCAAPTTTAPLSSARPSPANAARTSAPSATAAPPSIAAVSISSLHWEALGAIRESHVDGIVGFRGGYVAYGGTGPQLRPAAWFSADGESWAITELAGLVSCVESEATRAGYVTTGATNGGQVVLVGAVWPGNGRPCGETRPAAWTTVDGRSWTAAEAPDRWDGEFGDASAVWPLSLGWEAWVTSGDGPPALWQSADGVTWKGPTHSFDADTRYAAAAAAADGTRLMAIWAMVDGEQAQQTLGSNDGTTWTKIAHPAKEDWTIQRIVPPPAAGWPWVVLTNASGSDATFRTSLDRLHWTAAESPMPAIDDLVPTRYGWFSMGRIPCLDAGGSCPIANRTQSVSRDGLAWTNLDASVDATLVADGPAGVIGLGRSDAKGRTNVWRLLDRP